MPSTHYGQIDLTKLGQLVKNHPSLVKKVQFKDGVHQLLDVEMHERKEPDKFGNITSFIKARCRKDDQIPNVPYIFGDMKPSKFSDENNPDKPVQPLSVNNQEEDPDLPF